MSAIQLRNLTKIFPTDVIALTNFSLDIQKGEFLVLVGPSGCGKSTTLRLIAGLEELTEGDIFIGDRLVNDVPPKDRDIAMVFQNYALYPHMSVYKNMAFGLKLRKTPRAEIDTRVQDAARTLEITNLLDRMPKQLSGGQKQRVALGRAIVRQPTAFLFDEPLSNLDAKLRVQMRAQIKALHALLKTTVVYVTHDQVEAMTMGDRIVILKDGMTQQVGTPMEIYHQPANCFVAGFIGTPPMNMLPVQVLEDGTLNIERIDSRLVLSDNQEWFKDLKGQRLTLGIRSEDIVPVDPGSDEAQITLPVSLLEPLGNEILAHCRLAEGEIVVKTDQSLGSMQEGEELGLRFQSDKLHFFDGETGTTLTSTDPAH